MTQPQRPAFYEGQVIAAADLTAIVDHASVRAARHDRYLHEWGIAEGLGLTAEPQTDPGTNTRFVTVTVAPGVAVDGTGREVVVASPVTLSETEFAQVNGVDVPTSDPYPVFLAGLDRDPAQASIVRDTCGTATQQNRVDESYQILFGRRGDERLVGEQQPPAVTGGPGDGSKPWLILLGYVIWRSDGQHFIDTGPRAGGIGPRYAGVRADTVAARSGTLTLRSQVAAAGGGPVVTLDGTAGLAFGVYKADGSVDSLLTVSRSGDLAVRGSVASGQSGGQAVRGPAVASGVATDGMILPLPAGITAEQVTQGQIVLHTSITPHLTGAPPASEGVWLAGPSQSTVDSDRRVRCRMRWVRLGSGSQDWRDWPAAVDFVVLATVAANPDPNVGSGTA
jgi:hypothetical protein